MTISTTWSIKQCEREIATGKIYRVEAACLATDSEETITRINGEGQVQTFVELSGDVTVAYADVTESDVIGWVKAALGTDQVSVMESEAKDLLKDASATTASGLPWVTD